MDKEDFIDAMGYAASPDEVSALWQRLGEMAPDARSDTVYAVEALYVETYADEAAGYAPGWQKLLPPPDDARLIMKGDELALSYQATVELFRLIAEEKGEEAHPVIREVMQEAKKLSPDALASLEGQITLMITVRDNLSMPMKPPGKHAAGREQGREQKAIMPPPPMKAIEAPVPPHVPQKARHFRI